MEVEENRKVVYDPDNVVNTTYLTRGQASGKESFIGGYAMGLKFREQMPFNIKLWLRPLIFMALFTVFDVFCYYTLWDKVFLVPGVIFFYFIKLIDGRICSIRFDRYSKEQKRRMS